MKLLSKEILKKLPPLYASEQKQLENNEIKVPLKLFNAMGGQTWYITEYNPEDQLGYGWCDLGFGEAELGYVSIAELIECAKTNRRFMLERDLYWDSNTMLADVMAGKN